MLRGRARVFRTYFNGPLSQRPKRGIGGPVPDGYTIGLVLSSPILEFRKTKVQLAQVIRGHIADLTSLGVTKKITSNHNAITVFLNHHGEMGFDKVSAAFMNCNSSPDILSNVMQILEDRIVTKTKKCSRIERAVPFG